MLLALPFYTPNEPKRKEEVFDVLETHLSKDFIDQILLLIDDDTYLNEKTPSKKITICRFDKRPTYYDWIKESKKYIKKHKFLVCLNSDIELKEDFYSKITSELTSPQSVLMISRYEKVGNNVVELRKNPQWTQDTWCINSADLKYIDESFLKSLDIPFGYPRCDNKIAYEFAIRNWKIINPCERIITIHHQDSPARNYFPKDKRILGGVAYVYPNKKVAEKSVIDIEIFTLAKKTLPIAVLNQWLSHDEYIYDSYSELDVKRIDKYLRLSSLFRPINFAYKKSLKKLIGEFIPTIYNDLKEIVENKFDIKKSTLYWRNSEDYEKQTYEFHKKNNNLFLKTNDKIKIYLPLPWSEIIDRRITLEDDNLKVILEKIYGIYSLCQEFGWVLEIYTFCHHNNYLDIIEIFKKFRISELHITNYIEGKKNIDQIKLCKSLANINYLKDANIKHNINLKDKNLLNEIFKNFYGTESDSFDQRIINLLGTNTFSEDNSEYLDHTKNNQKTRSYTHPPLIENFSVWITLLNSILNAKGIFRMAAIGYGCGTWLVNAAKVASQRKIIDASDEIKNTELLVLEENQIEYENLINHFTKNKIKINNQNFLFGTISGDSVKTRFSTNENLNVKINSFESTKKSIKNNSSIPLETYSLEEIFNKFSGSLDLLIININEDKLNYLEEQIKQISSLVKVILINSKIKNELKKNTAKLFKDFGWKEKISYPNNFLDQTIFEEIYNKDDIIIFSNPSLI